MDVSAVAHAGHRSGGCGECRLSGWLVGSGGRDERWIIGDSAASGSGSGEVKREKGAESLGRGSRTRMRVTRA